MSKRKICVVTGSRAEYDLLYRTAMQIKESDDLELQLVVTGMHLSAEFGLTVEEIEKDGFQVSRKVEMLLSSDSAVGITKSTGLAMVGFADAFDELKPDIVLLLGDRFELLAAASAALFAVIPIAHIHGGEVTTGAFDDAIRHSITKMAHLHFTSTEMYRNRIIQLGEDPGKVFNVGAPGVENIHHLDLLDKSELELRLGLTLGQRSLLVTFHPETLKPGEARRDFQALLDALGKFKDINLVFTKANADTEGRTINRMIDEYVGGHCGMAVAYTSLGRLNYLSTLKHVSGVIGNSSSGIIEAPSLEIGTVNIGDRQKGRVRSASIIDCLPVTKEICNALTTLFSEGFQEKLANVVNPHQGRSVSEEIVSVLRTTSLEKLNKKRFYDLSLTRH